MTLPALPPPAPESLPQAPEPWLPGASDHAPEPVAVPAAPQRVSWGRIGVLTAVVALCLGCGVALLLIIGYRIGPVALGIGIAAAALPVPVLVSAFMWLDRYEPEPTVYLVACFVWGAFIAALAAYGGNTGMAALFAKLGLPRDLVAVTVAPVIEESMKALGPILLLVVTIKLGRRTFNGLIDAIVFFGMSAAGFAMSENILYLGGYGYAAGVERAGTAGGVSSVIAVFIVRIPLSGFAHPLFTAMTAIGVGVAIRSTDRRLRFIAPATGLLGAMLLHGSWNLMATLTNDTGRTEFLLYGYFAVMMPIFFAMVGFAMWLRSAEGRMTQVALAPYVRTGWLSPPEVASLATVGRRRSARAWARRVAGPAGDSAMRGFQLAATRLALLRDRAERRAADGLAAGTDDLADESRFLALVSAYRTGYVGFDPQTPPARWDGTSYHLRFPGGETWAVPAPAEPVMPVPMLAPPPPPMWGPPGYAPYPPALPYR